VPVGTAPKLRSPSSTCAAPGAAARLQEQKGSSTAAVMLEASCCDVMREASCCYGATADRLWPGRSLQLLAVHKQAAYCICAAVLLCECTWLVIMLTAVLTRSSGRGRCAASGTSSTLPKPSACTVSLSWNTDWALPPSPGLLVCTSTCNRAAPAL
jgi:hypothetical protein